VHTKKQNIKDSSLSTSEFCF